MAKKLQFLVLVLCMGLFLMPRQNAMAGELEKSCCKMEQNAEKSCHEDQQTTPCHDSEKKACDSQCTHCNACTVASVSTPAFLQEYIRISKKFSGEKTSFAYILPDYSAAHAKIWQPPKLG